MRPIELVAHRGMGQAFIQPDAPPENTLPAFVEGWRVVDACELDCHLSRDGQVIVVHDHTTGRTADADWPIGARTADELRTLDAGRWKSQRWSGTRLPLLEEVLEAIPAGKRLYVELKDGPQVSVPAAERIRASGKSDQVVVISFDVDTILEAKRALPDVPCLMLLSFEPDYRIGRWIMAYDEGPRFEILRRPFILDELMGFLTENRLDGIGTSFVVPPLLLNRVADESMLCYVWTVNDPMIALDVVRMGATTITTDAPAEMRDALAAAGCEVR